jgi:hypothetical protein
MSRTTSSGVQAILGSHYDGSTTLTPFIDTANNIVTWLASKDVNGELSAATLELIERWLSAHFYAQADPILQSKSTGKSSGVFEGQTQRGRYWDQAAYLDSTGNLNKRGKSKAGMTWLGKAVSDQTDYEDRD